MTLNILKTKGRRISLAGLSINLALGILYALTTKSLDEPAQNQSAWERLKTRVTFARAQSVDVDLGSRYL